jgi:predicted enzyme related to lactoylglutathione lyase
MAKVTGVGGVFIRARDKKALGEWYKNVLGFECTDWGGVIFPARRDDDPEGKGKVVWSLFNADTAYFGAAKPAFMINYTVDDLDAFVAELRTRGADVDEKIEASEFGRFGWVTDPEGNRVELWEPPKG